jgi:energy-coupling factor transport system substrate-specific component
MALERASSPHLSLPRPSLCAITFVMLNLVGLVAYLYPFIVARATRPESDWFAHNTDGPLLVSVVAALCLVLVISELTEGTLNSKSLAAIGVLAAMAAALRTITLPAGANLYFFLVILTGYAFGLRVGFLVGALSFFLSAIITAGIGPWLPFQVFASAWMGLSAGLLRPAAERAGLGIRGQVAILVAFGFAWGFLFGAITNLWAWPFFVSGPDVSYQPGLGIAETLRRYWNFYLLTSLGWDLLRALANAVAIAAVGAPLLRALTRYRNRFTWERPGE